jgi:AraC-like DNA-binding protein
MKTNARRALFFQKLGSFDQFLALFDLMPDVSFFMKDRQARFVALNRLGCEFCGVKSESEALGKTDKDFFPPARAAEYWADDHAVMKSGQPKLNLIEPAPEREGSPHLVITNKIPLRDTAGQVIGLAGFSRRVEHLRTAPSTMTKLAATVARLHRDHAEPITTKALAKESGLSVSQFERTFRKAFGTSVRQYLLAIRIEHACRLLSDTNDTVATIAVQSGFYDHAHFSRCFATLMGTTPSRYRKARQLPVLPG